MFYFIMFLANGISKFSTSEVTVMDFGVDNKEDQVSSYTGFCLMSNLGLLTYNFT